MVHLISGYPSCIIPKILIIFGQITRNNQFASMVQKLDNFVWTQWMFGSFVALQAYAFTLKYPDRSPRMIYMYADT